jgi:hypothetical protein
VLWCFYTVNRVLLIGSLCEGRRFTKLHGVRRVIFRKIGSKKFWHHEMVLGFLGILEMPYADITGMQLG